MTSPPVAKRVPHSFTLHGVTIEDPYAWLRDPGYPDVKDADVLAYLNAENAYFETAMKPQRGLVDTILAEMKGRIKDDDSSVPQKDGDYVYWHGYDIGAEYPKWYRRKYSGGADDVIIDEPALAAGHDYFRLGGHAVSPDGRLLAYAVDTNGSERYVLKVRDLTTGAERPDTIEKLPLHRRRRALALEVCLASPARRSAKRGPRNLSRARSEIHRQPRPHAVAALCNLLHRRPRDQRNPAHSAVRFFRGARAGLAAPHRPALRSR
jgi:hypothetical protein